MSSSELNSIAQAMVAPNKGILAADESTPTIAKRFKDIDTESTEANRQTYRNMLFTSPDISDYISGVILFDETIRQTNNEGVPFPEYLTSLGIVPGIKVDKGAKELAACLGETVTEGLDGLRDRLNEYYDLGARFAKWRAVIAIGDGIPSDTCINVNAHALARYSALVQASGMVPIVEPEVLMDGDHTIDTCFEVTAKVLDVVFSELDNQKVVLNGIILKPNMVISGTDASNRADVATVARATVDCLTSHVPKQVPGIAFLSGGQSSEEATAHLSAMNELGPHPWQLSFSYGRALQASPLRVWNGNEKNIEAAQTEFIKRSRFNGLARTGNYNPQMESA
ncbi:MAG: fructose-bisphosphate aldolase class I [Gammaproteobacteria bacterium]|nr:fructose-bisphosphate aldolase class I [Gammaproteobacteria bacterium]